MFLGSLRESRPQIRLERICTLVLTAPLELSSLGKQFTGLRGVPTRVIFRGIACNASSHWRSLSATKLLCALHHDISMCSRPHEDIFITSYQCVNASSPLRHLQCIARLVRVDESRSIVSLMTESESGVACCTLGPDDLNLPLTE